MRLSARTALAYHEAGHLVAAWRSGFRIRRATIIPADDVAGLVEHDSPLKGVRLETGVSEIARVRTEKAIVVCLAGPAAQRRSSARSWRTIHGERDYQVARDLAGCLNAGPAAATAHLQYLEVVAYDLVAEYWHFVDATAQELLLRGSLDTAQVESVIKSALAQAPSAAVAGSRRNAGIRQGFGGS